MYHRAVRLVLASASPRRVELLAAAGFAFEIRPAEIDETVEPGEDAVAYVRRLAWKKATAVRREPGSFVLAADTTVTVDEAILGKPADAEDARRMLKMLAGRTHAVLTGVTVIGDAGDHTSVATTRVRFLPLTEGEIDWYVASGEPFDRAGAYAIQGRASRFVDWIEGSYSNVVGLPVSLVYRVMREAGAPVLESTDRR